MFKSIYLSACIALGCSSTWLYAEPLSITSPSIAASRFENLLQAAPYNQDAGKYWTLQERMQHYNVPAVSIAVIRDGKLAWAKAYGVKQAGTQDAVDTDTVFSVGSVSKVGAATLVMRLVDEGKLNLDTPVNQFLQRWQVPENEFTAIQPVTLRGILSHSAGLSVHGFADYQPQEKLPDIIDILDGQQPAKNAPVRVQYIPGSRSQYSGGGTTVAQLAVEDLTGLAFPQAAEHYLFKPLKMTRSTYANPLPAQHGNIAKAHNREGKPVALPRGWESMPEMAASGLWTTPTDYARMIIALMDAYHNRSAHFLNAETARHMMSEVGISNFGLGPVLSGAGADRIFSHSGANDSYRAWMEGNLGTGNGMVILTNSSNGEALFQEIKRAIEQTEGWHQLDDNRQTQLHLTEKELRKFVGKFALKQDASPITRYRGTLFSRNATGYQVTLEKGHLKIAYLDAKTFFPLRAITPNRFRVLSNEGETSIEFVQGIDGKYEILSIRNGESILNAVRIP